MPPVSSKEIVLKPNTGWLYINIQELIAYRDLLWLLIRRDFVSRYKQTVLGPIWFLVNPIVTTLTFTMVFNGVIGITTDNTPPVLFYMSGMLTWNYFNAVLGGTSNSLAGNTHLFAKVYFPRLIPPLATTISGMFTLLIQLLTFLFFYIHYKMGPEGSVLSSPSLLWLSFIGITIHTAALGLGLGLIFSATSAKYRDLQQAQGYVIGLLIYATPVIYPLSKIPQKYQWIANMNPMTAIVEATRFVFLGNGTVSTSQYTISLAVSCILLFVGVFAYQRSARTFVDTV